MTRRWWSLASAAITLAAAARVLLPAVADPDLWGHIVFGQRTLELGLERVDPFSYLSGGHEWINHEVLSEVTFALAYRIGGGLGLIALKALIGLTLVGLIYRHLIRRGSDPLRAGLLLLPTVLLMGPGLATVRPQMFTFLLFTFTLLILHHVESGNRKWIWVLPVIVGFWVNLHGGVLAGVGVLGVWGLATTGVALRAKNRHQAWSALQTPIFVGLLCGVALLANPYGIRLPEFLLRTATLGRPDIIEWQPLRVASVPGLVYLAVVAIAGCTLLRARGRVTTPLVAVLVVVVVMPLTAIRHLQLFAIGVPILIADAFAEAWRRQPSPRQAAAAEKWIVGATTAVASLALVGIGLREAGCIRIDPARSAAFPVRAVQWLADSGVEGNLATYFDWGEYAIWHLAPTINVSMDGRRETVYPDSIYQEYLRFQNGVGEWRGLLDRESTDMVLFPRGRPAYNLTALDPEWRQVYADPLAGIFLREGDPRVEKLKGTPIARLSIDGAGMCVP